MADLRSQLGNLNAKIATSKKEAGVAKSKKFETQRSETQEEIEKCDREIETLTDQIEKLQQSTSQVGEQLRTQREEAAAYNEAITQRKKTAESRNQKVVSEIRGTKDLIAKLDAELLDLEKREAVCKELYDSFQAPIPVIERILSNI
jgi:chromosome segregation ATPase